MNSLEASEARRSASLSKLESRKPIEVKTGVDELIALATTDTYDWHTTLSVIDEVATFSIRKSTEFAKAKPGIDVLHGIEEYLRNNGITHKLIRPQNGAERQSDTATYTIAQKIKTKLQQLASRSDISKGFQLKSVPHITSLHDLITHIIDSSGKESKSQNRLMPLYAFSKEQIKTAGLKDPNILLLKRYEDLLSYLVNLSSDQPNRVNNSLQTFLELSSQLSITASQFEDPVYRSFGNVSLFELLAHDGEDEDRYARNVLQYLAHIPRGDIFWQRVYTLFTLPVYDTLQLPDDIDSRRFLYNRYVFLQWVSEKLLIPAFYERFDEIETPSERLNRRMQRDHEFDNIFIQALSGLPYNFASVFGKSIYIVAERSPHIRKLFDQTYDYATGVTDNTIFELCAELTREPFTGIRILSRTVRNVLVQDLHLILVNFDERFNHLLHKGSGFRALKQALREYILVNYDEQHAQSILDHFIQNVGGNFLERLRVRATEIDAVSDIIRDEIQDIEYSPHGDAVHEVTFSHQSLGEILGLSKVVFTFGSEGNIGVHYYLSKPDNGLTGYIDSEGSLIWQSDETILNPELLIVLRYITLATLKDLVAATKIEIHERKIIRTNNDRLDDPSESSSKRKSGRKRHLPKRRVVYINPNEGDIRTTDSLTTILHRDGEKRGVTPCLVGSFKRKSPHLAEYLQAVSELYHANQSLNLEMSLALQEARKLIRQPHPDKVQNLPPRFSLNPLIHPDTGEQLLDVKEGREGHSMWQETWVRQHYRPPLTAAEQQSMPELYRRRYSRSSALGFDQELIAWIVGLDIFEEEIH